MRLEMSRRSHLALRSIAVLHEEEALDGPALAHRVGTTPAYLPHVLRPLVQAGWIASARGPGGGYRLEADLGEVTVLDVIEAIEGPTDTGRCVLRDGPCPPEDRCALHGSWLRARSALLAELGNRPLAEELQRSADGSGRP